MSKKMNKKKDETTEQRILDAAERLFLEKGFAMTSTTEIAREAGCNHALLHYYFRTKERLFEQIFEKKIILFAGVFHGPDLPGESFEDKLRRKISAHFDILIQNPKLPMLILTDMTNSKERIALAKEALGHFPEMLLSNLDKELKIEIEKGSIRPITAQDLLMNILSLNIFAFVSMPLFTMILEVREEDKKVFLEHRKEVIINTIINSLKP